MSSSSLLNSPNPTYEYPLSLANSVVSASLVMDENDGSTVEIIPAICVTNNTTNATLSVPAGTYNIQMICGIKPPVNASLNYAELVILDSSGDVVTSSSSKSFSSGATSIANVFWSFNESKRVVFGKTTIIKMNLVYSGLVGASTLYNGITPAYQINLNPQIILTPTF
jgi:hypothetical protein